MRRNLITGKTFVSGVLGFASALPFVFLTGSLAAWFAELGVSMATIGLLSSITLAYGFKVLWAPVVQQRLHRWMALCLFGMAFAFIVLARIEPLAAMNEFALVAFAATLLSATFDTAFEAWRIKAADADSPIELLLTASQMGARGAVLAAGAGALWLSGVVGWKMVVEMIAAVFALTGALILSLPLVRAGADHAGQTEGGEGNAALRGAAVLFVAAGIVTGLWQVFSFISALSSRSGDQQAQVDSFTMHNGPLIIAMVAVVPVLGSQFERWGIWLGAGRVKAVRASGWVNHFHDAMVAPFGNLLDRFGATILLLFLFISFYTLSWFCWAGFTLPLYLRELGYSKPEVALAARLYGSLPTALGILLGGFALLRMQRLTALLIGAILPLISNLVYIDLAQGGQVLGAIVDLGMTGLGHPVPAEGAALGKLYLAITLKNTIAGMASAIFVGFLASLVDRRYAAVQCAVFSSLSFVVGTIASAAAGHLIDRIGFAGMLERVSGFALVAAVLCFALSRSSKLGVGNAASATTGRRARHRPEVPSPMPRDDRELCRTIDDPEFS